ncbi:MAG TPA: PKD domain-containing protein, partial [Candidatus Polarisedimenticolia bacterium]
NGLTTNENDLYVDGTSAASFASDYDLFWNSSPGITVRFNDVSYGTFTGYRTATGFEPNGREGDPRFANAPTGDLHLASISSSAVDSADASTAGFSQEDQEGRLPIDLLTVPDAGAGIPTFADRGAYEYDAPPTATLKLTPSSGAAPLAVTADAVGSSDPDTTGIASYLFSFGDGASVGPQSQSSATHTYTQTGTYTASVKVTDTAGLSSIASGQVVAMDTPPVARLTLTPTSGRVPLPVTANASASTDTDSTPIATYRFDFGDGTIVGPQAGAIATHTYTTTKTFKVTVTVTDTAGFSTSLTKNVMVKK